MIHTKKLTEQIERNKRLREKLSSMIVKVTKRLKAQGTGCFIDGSGVAYYNRKEQTLDPIAILLDDVHGNITRNYYGFISGDAQKPLISHLVKKYKIDDTVYSERDRFVNFLQDIQDAHDAAWDMYRPFHFCNSMDHFLNSCEVIKQEYRL